MIKNYKTLGICFVIILGFFFVFSGSALAAPATFPQATTVQLTIGSVLTNFIISAGSTADSVVAQASSLIVTISAGETFTLWAVSSNLLNNNGGFTYSCDFSNHEILTLSAASSTTITITPSSTTVNCAGSGGGGYSYAPITTPTPILTPSASPSPVASSSPLISPAPSNTPIPTLTFVPIPTVTVIQLVRKVNDPRVYVKKSDGTLTWVKTLQEFNNAGYKWSDVKLLSAKDFKKLQVVQTPLGIVGKVKILNKIKFLNVRSAPSLQGKIIGKVYPGDVLDYTSIQNGWYKINLGWISGVYARKM